MQIKSIFKTAMPHLVAVFIFLIITLIYFYPVLEGKVIQSNDGTVARNASKEISDYRNKFGSEPLWTNAMFSGMPAYLISARFPGNLMRFADAALKIIKMPVASIFLTMLGFYILLLIFRVKPWLAIAGAIVYGLSTYFFFILTAGHNTKAIAIAYMAPMIGGIYYTYKYDAIKGALLTGLFLSLEIIANHPQITYYSLICVLILVVAEFIFLLRKKEIKQFFVRSAILAIPVVLAVGMNFGSLYTTYEYGKYSIRGKSDLISVNKNSTKGLDLDYATQWSYGIDETMTLLIPNFKGGSAKLFSRESKTITALKENNAIQAANEFYQYWGTQPWTDGPVYVGAIVVFLFILGLILIKGPEKWWLLAATILSIMLAWGKNFMPLTNLFMNYFPGYNKFRAVTMTLVIAEFCMPLLAILTLRDIFDGKVSKKEFISGLKIAFGIAGGLTMIFVLFPGIAGSFISPMEEGKLPVWLSSALKADRINLLRADSLRSFAFISLGAAVLLGFYFEKIRKEYAILLLGFLFLVDMFSIDKRYLNADNFKNPVSVSKASAPSPADSKILEDKSYYRVLNLSISTFNDASTSQFHKSIGGYNGAKIRRYQDLIDSTIIEDIIIYQRALSSAKSLADLNSPITRLCNNNALRMLNARYFIINPNIAPVVNDKALGNAWFVDSVVFASDANEELALVSRIEPSVQADVDVKFKNLVKVPYYRAQAGDSIRLTSYKPNELIYKYSSGGERLAVFSEIWYPAGWKAFIDGKPSDYLRVDWILRGMVVPAGAHEIRFSFEPASYYTGNKVSLASSVIFILLAAGYIIITIINKRKLQQDVSS
ncbi:MAG: hypothetical protein ABR974_12190 [Bacteroidales bacterium]|jgi:hypothetical protein